MHVWPKEQTAFLVWIVFCGSYFIGLLPEEENLSRMEKTCGSPGEKRWQNKPEKCKKTQKSGLIQEMAKVPNWQGLVTAWLWETTNFPGGDLCGTKVVHNEELMCFRFVRLFYVLGHLSPETQQFKMLCLSCVAITLQINVWGSSTVVFVGTQIVNKVNLIGKAGSGRTTFPRLF